MSHPRFREELFIETGFERRFQAMLRSACQNRSWHVIVADPGSGKTMGIYDLVERSGTPTFLAVNAPKNDAGEQALGNQFFTALGMTVRERWISRKPKLIASLVKYNVKCLIVDDAQDLSLAHLMYIKELTDQGRLHYNYPLGLCLVTAGRGNTIPLKEIFDQPDTMWLQFRRRLDKQQPFCRIAGHTRDEVREILAALDTVYCDLLPQLNLRQWSTSIYQWLTQPVLDQTNSGRVTMDSLMKLVTMALEWAYDSGRTDVSVELLGEAASLLALRRDDLHLIDGDGPALEESTDVSEGIISTSTQVTELPTKAAKCPFSGEVPIDLQRFLDSGTARVECPNCASTRALTPAKGKIRFPLHDPVTKRPSKTRPRWAWIDSAWEVVGA